MAETPTQGFKMRLLHLGGNFKRPPNYDIKNNTKSEPIEVDELTIHKNMEPLKYDKKKAAQRYYYEKQLHQSPLVKEERKPVRARLGALGKQMTLKRLMPAGTNTAAVLPRRRNKMFNRPLKRLKHNRNFSAQDRLERIRAQQNYNTLPLKLRRLHQPYHSNCNNNRLLTSSASNLLTVEVKNPDFYPSNNGQTYPQHFQKFKMILNRDIQLEIASIQAEPMRTHEGPISPDTRFTPEVTDIYTSIRFGLL